MTHDRSVAKLAPELGSTRDKVAFLLIMRPSLTGAQREAQQMCVGDGGYRTHFCKSNLELFQNF